MTESRELEVRSYDIWDDWLMVILIWVAFTGFGWLIGWTLGLLA